jgi:hypothetical protein
MVHFPSKNPIHSHTCCISLSHITPHFGVKSRLLSAPLSAQIPVAQHAHELEEIDASRAIEVGEEPETGQLVTLDGWLKPQKAGCLLFIYAYYHY